MYKLNNSFCEDKFLDEYYKSLKNKNEEKTIEIIKKRISQSGLTNISQIKDEDINQYFTSN